MKRNILLFLLILLTLQGFSQSYGNEWIDYSKTYYKFSLGSNSIYRISDTVLTASGLGSTPAEQFQLWHNGQQVPLYTSVPSGLMTDTDYLEFYGQQNDGIPDIPLYDSAGLQMTTGISLFTDTSAYYLTINPSGGNARIVATPNNTTNPPLPAEAYFMNTASEYFRLYANSGYAQLVSGDYIYAPTYDAGEGLTSDFIQPGSPMSQTLVNIFPYAGGPAASFTATAAGDAPNARDLKITLNGNQLADSSFSQFALERFAISGISPATLITGSNTVSFINGSATSTDRVVVSDMELTYPSQFNFGGQSFYSFRIAAGSASKYLVISNFSNNAQQPILYDLTNGLRLLGSIDSPGVIRFLLPPSGQPRQLVLSAASAIIRVSTLTPRSFVNYALPANQGNYLIITNQVLLNDGSGNNDVEQYRAYRASGPGGGYNAKTILIDQLIDQFAYGIKNDPLSIRNFSRFALNTFAVKPTNIFLIGNGITYDQYRFVESYPSFNALELVPTFGSPGSDVLLTAAPGSFVPQIPIGRLPAVNGTEIGIYLAKVRQYEGVLNDSIPADQTLSGRGWTKNFLDIVGANDIALESLISSYFNGYDQTAEDTLMGANVYRAVKSSTGAVQQASSQLVDSLFNAGIGFIQYFGHSSATTLGFNLDQPNQLGNPGRYPVFLANGCNAGDIFVADTLRLQGRGSLSEQFLLAPDAGSIAFLASTSLGITNVLDYYTTNFYRNMCSVNYGGTLGSSIRNTISSVNTGQNDFLDDANAEAITLDGDPALRTYSSPLPDYDIEPQDISFSPPIVTVSQGSYQLNFRFYNIGRAVMDSLTVQVQRIFPDGHTAFVYNKRIPGPFYSDSVQLTLPVNPLADAGQNRFLFSLDPDNLISEVTKANNQTEKDLYIYEDDIKPIYPFNYSIMGRSGFTWAASTADPFAPQAQYLFQMDTSGNFNSPLLVQNTASGIGGLYRFNPLISLQDGTVYYWRVGKVPAQGQTQTWNENSFWYATGDSAGWNQSQYFQYPGNSFSNILLDSTRIFKFTPVTDNLELSTVLFPYNTDNQKVTENGFVYIENDCGNTLSSLQFVIYTPVTGLPFIDQRPDGSTFYGSHTHLGCNSVDFANFDYSYTSLASRELILAFLDSIPAGSYVSMTNWASNTYLQNTTFINAWRSDSTTLGSGNTLYDKLKQMGFTQLDSFYHNIPFLFFFKKNADGSFTPVHQQVGTLVSDQLTFNYHFTALNDQGSMLSPLIGPSLGWKEIRWHSHSLDTGPGDSSTLQIYGVDNNGNSTLLYNNTPSDTALTFISPVSYPFLQLKLNTEDTVNGTPAQLDYWRVFYDQAPEGALAPNIYFNFQDTLDLGQPLQFSIAFANVSPTAFDSMAINLTVTDQANVVHILPLSKERRLLVNDTLHVSFTVDTKNMTGLNTLYVEVNPSENQPEQYHFNNFGYKQFYVRPDQFNPLMDVTFDGIHILNDDIVSARPHILLRLSDQSKYIALNDTSLMTLQVVYPDGSLHPYYFSNDTVHFTPADTSKLSSNNAAQVDFYPYFPQDGTYELVATGRNPAGTSAGTVAYRVSFQIINKPMISDMLNYPNPFTTSTAFVFTLTGFEIPSQLKIEIMTITGKIVRVITRQQLGPLHIGRNITQYKWNGTDQYGQRLANGIYLYRVVSSLNGSQLTHFQSGADQYITKGYGKMYLMR